ncbi:DUF3426 domain-containing protein [Acidovorax sp. SDU_ACID1]|uniref:DUF3426 domain-containing protein n=1 Tax=Acidovorax sp. SDU_ACID1 TaxID=3136632 RepID=UPI003872C936
MSQITRCPFCETSFKVVADQLRISDGWVRCGQCKQVFDASQHLHAVEQAPLLPEMPLDALRPLPAPATLHTVQVWGSARVPLPPADPVEPAVAVPESASWAPPVPPPPAWHVPHPPVPSFLIADASQESAAPQAAPFEESLPPLPSLLTHEAVEDAPSAAVSVEEAPALAQQEAEAVQEPPLSSTPAPLPAQEEGVEPQVAGEPSDEPDSDEPEFVRAARRNAFWRQPVVRAAVLLAAVVLACMLAVQVALQERDALAARYPATRPWLADLCARLHCVLEAPRRISAVVIDSSSFAKARDDASAYQLQVSLKNTSATVVAMPALELTLTDAQDQAVLRRVLMPGDVAAPAELAAGGIWNGAVAVRMASGAAQVAGYRILAFYP